MHESDRLARARQKKNSLRRAKKSADFRVTPPEVSMTQAEKDREHLQGEKDSPASVRRKTKDSICKGLQTRWVRKKPTGAFDQSRRMGDGTTDRTITNKG